MNPETIVQQEVLLALSGHSTLFRNNCGGFKTKSGRVIKYGIANPGGSDLIGWTPLKITREMAGRTVAIFTALEVKTPEFIEPRNTHEMRQEHFITVVRNAGGIADFVRSANEATQTIKEML